MKTSGRSPAAWHTILGKIFRPEMLPFFPDKVFLVQKNGTYDDAFYPLPCLHLLHGQSLIGQTIRHVFSRQTWLTIQSRFREVERTRRYRKIWIPSGKPAHPIHHTHLTILTFETRFLLFAKDYTAADLPLLSFQFDAPPILALRKQLWPHLSTHTGT